MIEKQNFFEDDFMKFINSTGVLAKETVANLPAFEQLSLLLPYLSKVELCKLKGMIADLEEGLGGTPGVVADLKLQLSCMEEKLL